MNQVYLLLRNNEQSGPYSHDDLPALQLTEKDMVKVAGSNSGWFYPYELGLPFVLSSRLNKTSPTVIVEPKLESIKPTPSEYSNEHPPDEVDQTIEELSKKITSMRNNLRMVEEQIHADKGEQQQKKSIIPARRKKTSTSGAVLVVLFFLLLILSFLVYKQYLQPSSKNTSAATSSAPRIEYVEEPLTFGYTDTTQGSVLIEADSSHTLLASATPASMAAKQKRNRPKTQPGPVQPIAGNTDAVVLRPEEIGDDKKVSLSYVLAEEQRRTLLQKIADLFRKKEEPVNTSSNPITEESVNDKLKISINTTNYSWLKGVQGLTLTLHNQSSQTLKAANVNVVYYNKENAVIEKSTVHFSNIKPSKWQAVAAPDHTWADHAGYEIVSVAVVKN